MTENDTFVTKGGLAARRAIYPDAGGEARRGKRLAVAVARVVVAVLIGVYIGFLTNGPTPYRRAGRAERRPSVDPDAADGRRRRPAALAERELGLATWSARTASGSAAPCGHCPRHTLVHVTLYNFDGKSGLRNPFLAQARGLVGGTFGVDGKPMSLDRPGRRVTHVRDPAARA